MIFHQINFLLKVKKKEADGSLITCGYEKYYTKEAMEKEGLENYILNPVKPK